MKRVLRIDGVESEVVGDRGLSVLISGTSSDDDWGADEMLMAGRSGWDGSVVGSRATKAVWESDAEVNPVGTAESVSSAEGAG